MLWHNKKVGFILLNSDDDNELEARFSAEG